jgi:hypothetical protein
MPKDGKLSHSAVIVFTLFNFTHAAESVNIAWGNCGVPTTGKQSPRYLGNTNPYTKGDSLSNIGFAHQLIYTIDPSSDMGAQLPRSSKGLGPL